jgi:nickel/cobalt transporter (NicO) family protein
MITKRLLPLLCGILGLMTIAFAGHWLYSHWGVITYQLIRWQMQFHRELGTLLRASASLKPTLVISLIGASFAYGVFHAAGPGHGKMVIATYLATQPSRLRQAMQLSIGAALLQALVAIALIGVAGWLFGMTARQAQGMGVWLDRGSFLLVALMGLFLALRALRQGWRLYRQTHHHVTPLQIRSIITPLRPLALHSRRATARQEPIGVRHPDPVMEAIPCGCGHSHVPDHESLNQANDWRSRLAILCSMGLRPCSGALLVLVLARVMEHFWLGVIATLAMACGTALTVSTLAILSQRARHLAWRLLQRPDHNRYRLQQMGHGVALLGGIVLLLLGLTLMSAPSSLLLPR